MNRVVSISLSLSLIAITFLATPAPPADAAAIYDMTFPIIGEVRYSDTWGAARSGGRTHTGTDIMAAKLQMVVAVADGTVYWAHDDLGGNCCAMGVRHDDGWTSYYIHLNNDTLGTDDGQGWGFAPGITVGTHVTRGQWIGYVGDSGNAENSGSHLHYELHQPDGTRINPYEHLLAAEVLENPTGSDWCEIDGGPVCPLPTETGTDVAILSLGTASTQVETFLSSGTSFTEGWVSNHGSVSDPETTIGGRTIAGDFNGDGTDDIAVFHDTGAGAEILTSISDGSDFSTSSPWWKTSSGYALEKVDNRMVTGDFNADGRDDIAVFYDYGSGARIHTFLSTGYSFRYQGSSGWWKTSSGYALEKVDNRMVTGDFNADGRDDIAVFYDYGSGARIHTFLSTGYSFRYQGSSGWWKTSSGYALEKVDNRMVTGDFNADGTDDIAVFYDYGSGARIHTFLSTGYSFRYQGSSGWWKTSSGYALEKVDNRMVTGDFNADDTDDIAVLYDYGSGARIHTFLSTGYSFRYQGSSGWWRSDSYSLGPDDTFLAGSYNR